MNKQTVLLTGGAGSLGTAFVRLLHDEYDLIVVDNNEWAIAELKGKYPNVKVWLGEFYDYPLSGYEDFIIHAAAYKHVHLGEALPRDFIRNNLINTIKFYEKAEQTLAKILYISTDKAVEPISVYGATKYLAERLTYDVGGAVARLGNILKSSGSVVPTWEQQIEAKVPITITDERMTRYMIEDSDAVNQVWNEFKKGEVLIIPKMGEPFRIMDMLTQVLERHGYATPEQYEPGVTFIGIKPGEKLSEKLRWDHE